VGAVTDEVPIKVFKLTNSFMQLFQKQPIPCLALVDLSIPNHSSFGVRCCVRVRYIRKFSTHHVSRERRKGGSSLADAEGLWLQHGVYK
jgi:hypothetical protein